MLNEDSLLFAWLGNGVIGMAYVQMTYFSPALAKTTRMNLILPEDRPGPWKVLWLLHGWSEDCTAWQRFSSVERYVQPYGLAVVMPDAHLSFYHDMEHGPAYYTHIAKELPELVARMFPVSQKREDTFIAGLSMGGYGALRVAMSQPERFAGVGCFSAANFAEAIAEPGSPLRHDESAQWLGWMDNIFGKSFQNLMGGESDIYALADAALAAGKPVPKVYHCIGTEDSGYQGAQATRAYFEQKPGDPFHYRYEEGPGVHDWRFWDAHIEPCLRHFGFAEGK